MKGRLQSLLYNLPPCNSQALYNYSLNLNFRVLVVGIDEIDEGWVVYADGHFLGCYVFEILSGTSGFSHSEARKIKSQNIAISSVFAKSHGVNT